MTERTIWHSGQVNRWHTHPILRNSGDCTDSHSARMCKLALWLFPDDCDANMLAEIIMHDAAEMVTGDVPSPAKRGILGVEVRAAEAAFRRRNKIDYRLTARQSDIVAFLDLLDAWLWAQQRSQYGKEWDDDLAKLRAWCDRFGLPVAVLHGVF